MPKQCWKKFKRFFLKKVIPQVTDTLWGHGQQLVMTIDELAKDDPGWWTDDNKMKVAKAAMRAHRDMLKLQVPNRVINLMLEALVTALHDPDGPLPGEVATPEDFAEALAEGEAIQ